VVDDEKTSGVGAGGGDGDTMVAEMTRSLPGISISDRGVEIEFPSGDSVLISVGGEGKSEAQIVRFGSGYAVAWHEADSGVIKLRGLDADGAPFGTEVAVGAAGFDNHSLSISGFGRDDGGRGGGLTLAWVAEAGDGSGLGRIVLQRFSVELDALGQPTEIVPAEGGYRSATMPTASLLHGAWLDTANDNTFEVAGLGRDPLVSSLHSGDTLIAWVGPDDHLHGAILPADHGDEVGGVSLGARAAEYEALNTALADLGAVAPESAQRRIKSVELGAGQIALMWIALGTSGAELRGGIFTLPSGGSNDHDAAGQLATSIAPIKLPPNFDGHFELAQADDGLLTVSYQDAEGQAATPHPVRVGLSNTDSDPIYANAAEDVGSQGHHHSASVSGSGVQTGLEAADQGSGDEFVPHGSSATTVFATKVAFATGPIPGHIELLTIAGSEGDDGADQTTPVIAATNTGFVAAWQETIDGSDKVSLKVSIHTGASLGGSADAPPPKVVEVTSDLDTSTPPAIAGTGDGATVAWVESNPSASTLLVEVIDPTGAASSPVTVDSGAKGSYSDLSIAEQTIDSSVADGYEQQVALVWVEDADDEGYGSINLQRYARTDVDGDGKPELRALGIDGKPEGNNSPQTLTSEDDSPAVGRDPQAAGLSDGDLAVLWVERDSSGKGKGGIEGVVYKYGSSGGDGTRLNLTSLMPNGVADGTKPTVMTTPAGDILVAWLEPGDGKGAGYDFKFTAFHGTDGWAQPSATVTLHHFNDEPHDFWLALAGGDTAGLLLTWREDHGNDIYGQRFDLAGTALENAFDVTSQSGGGTSGAAGLADGRVVVVYSEQDGKDVDVKATVIDFSRSSGSSGSSPPDASKIVMLPDSAIATDTSGTADWLGFPGDSTQDSAQAVVPDVTVALAPAIIDSGSDWSGLSGSTSSGSSGSGSPESSDSASNSSGSNSSGTSESTSSGSNSSGSGTSEGSGSSDDVVVAVSTTVAKSQGDPVLLDPLADSQGSGLHIATINGRPITLGEPVDVGSGFVQLRDDGKLLFSPDAGFSGEAHFQYTTADASGAAAQRSEFKIEVAPEPVSSLFDPDYDFDFAAWKASISGKSGIYISESSLAASMEVDHHSGGHDDYDILVFKPGFGSDVIRDFHGAPDEVIDISSYGYQTFQALQEAGALLQVGDDVLIMLTPSDPVTSDKITLKSYHVSNLMQDDFKFS
jgi:hypothetical protein